MHLKCSNRGAGVLDVTFQITQRRQCWKRTWAIWSCIQRSVKSLDEVLILSLLAFGGSSEAHRCTREPGRKRRRNRKGRKRKRRRSSRRGVTRRRREVGRRTRWRMLLQLLSNSQDYPYPVCRLQYRSHQKAVCSTSSNHP